MAPTRISSTPGDTYAEQAPIQSLTSTQLKRFNEDGYLLIPNALSPSTVSSLLSETHSMLSNFSLKEHPMTKFTTGDGDSDAHVGDEYFLTSGDKIRFFFETDAFSPSQPDRLLKPKERAINKIGHYLHELSAPFRSATFTPLHASIARAVGFRDPRVLQSMVICKQPEIGGEVPPHQDSTFLYTNPPSAVGFWIALEDATAENGCLSFAKGSHRRTPVRTRFVRKEKGNGTTFADVEGAMFPEGLDHSHNGDKNGGNNPGTCGTGDEDGVEAGGGAAEEEYELGPVSAGTLVLIHGNLLHKSEKNRSAKSRFIYTFHVIEGDLEYDDRNWLQPPEGKGFSRLHVVE